MNERLPLAFLLAAVALSLYGHSMVFNEWVMPTYGNTMIHVASARHAIETGDTRCGTIILMAGASPTFTCRYTAFFTRNSLP